MNWNTEGFHKGSPSSSILCNSFQWQPGDTFFPHLCSKFNSFSMVLLVFPGLLSWWCPFQYSLNISFPILSTREKGRDLTQYYDKSPYTNRKIQKATWQHKKSHQNFDYTTIADRLRTVSWGNDSFPTGVVKPVNGIPTHPLTTTVV